MTRINLHECVPESLSGQRLDQAAAALFPAYSRSRLKAWIVDGSLTLDGATLRPRDKVCGGETLRVEATLVEDPVVTPQPVVFGVVHEEPSLLVIDKPAGLVVHPGSGNHDRTLQNGLLHRLPELAAVPRAGIVHRLDKDTSGLMLVAKSLPAHTQLVRALAAREVAREYLAVCDGVLTAGGRIDAPIARHPTQRTRMSVRPTGKPALTHYRVVERFRAHTLIRLLLDTGRTHQIRVHMAHIRHALVGDPVYGTRLKLPPGADAAVTAALRGFRRQALHATRLAFAHPETGAAMEFVAEPPADFRALAAALAAHTREPADD